MTVSFMHGGRIGVESVTKITAYPAGVDIDVVDSFKRSSAAGGSARWHKCVEVE